MGYRRRRRHKRGSANAVCDRSGFVYPMNEMVVEEGTGWLVHYTEDDGMYNQVSHPLNRIQDYAEYGDPFPVENARDEQEFVGRGLLAINGDDDLLIDKDGTKIYTTRHTRIV